jgi:hypothetical protein
VERYSIFKGNNSQRLWRQILNVSPEAQAPILLDFLGSRIGEHLADTIRF